MPPRLFLSALAATALLMACAGAHGSHAGPESASAGEDGDVLDPLILAGDTAFDRSAFGAGPLPIWSELTPPELAALQGRDKARAGETHALLALAIFASGDKRSSEDYAAITARYDAFVAQERPAMDREKNPRFKGTRLLRDMHEAFFLKGPSNGRGIRPGYAKPKSGFTAIFAGGRFNCVSSAILYLILAREFGMPAEGAVMPSHAFVQVAMPDGKITEVETTIPSGFGTAHDEAFFNQGNSWFTALGLGPASVRDYRKRRILDPVALIAFNMWNQHIAPLSLKDRYRLVEARAWLTPSDTAAQTNRIAVYHSEITWLSLRNEWTTLDRMFRTLEGTFPGLRIRVAADSVLADEVAWLAYYRARCLLGLGKGEEGIPWIDSSLAWLIPSLKEGQALRENAVSLLIRITQEMVEKKAFARAETYLLRYPALSREDADFRTHLAWFYGKRSSQAFSKSDWVAAAADLEKAIPYAGADNVQTLRNNLAATYYNRAVAFYNSGDKAKAGDTLRRCLEKVPDAKACREGF